LSSLVLSAESRKEVMALLTSGIEVSTTSSERVTYAGTEVPGGKVGVTLVAGGFYWSKWARDLQSISLFLCQRLPSR